MRGPLRDRLGLILLAAALAVTGCSASRENSKLRRERAERQDTIAKLTADLEAREAEIDALRQQLGRASKVEGIDLPILTSLRLGRLSGLVDTDGDGTRDLLRLYVTPRDDRGRFRAFSGTARLTAVDMTAQDAPRVIIETDFDGPAVDNAYRSGFAGTHYTFETPIDTTDLQQLTVSLVVTDAESGIQLNLTETYPVR
ncbi:hypothetical protein [Mucisphaera calidilacus]|uniref:Lipoprotein n=1 Tax=Mucisphaera calidilacus TaxID=2527982 RepID=A0A518C0H3_9BACT|nr:hypothetical protein [Mucisphaera calidilacus]QDU72714.1 hypothetical protein Pan265_25880 [Mucisphaera calidilacus]